jgi:hypothetical protein
MSSDATAASPSQPFIRRNIEVVIATLLGLIATFTAYTSFQSSLYDGNQAQAYVVGTTLATEAESLYLEGNQQYVQDAQLYDRLTDLRLDTQNPNPDIASAAQAKYDAIYRQSVSADFDKAIEWADGKNEASPKVYSSPLDNEDYQDSLFGTYGTTKEEAVKKVAEGHQANIYSDRLTLTTVLMSMSLFLLGISAVVRQFRVQVILGSVAVAIFVVAVVLMLGVPALPLWA